jgi:hypothetical protein
MFRPRKEMRLHYILRAQQSGCARAPGTARAAQLEFDFCAVI